MTTQLKNKSATLQGRGSPRRSDHKSSQSKAHLHTHNTVLSAHTTKHFKSAARQPWKEHHHHPKRPFTSGTSATERKYKKRNKSQNSTINHNLIMV